MARAFITTPMLIMLVVITASAQSHVEDIRTSVEARFDIVPIANGVVLTPRFRTSIKSIEVSESAIAIDGAPVTGKEVTDRLGRDADVVLRVSYLEPAARRELAIGASTRDARSGQDQTAPALVDPTAPTIDRRSSEPDPEVPRIPRGRRRDDIVRIGGNVTVDS